MKSLFRLSIIFFTLIFSFSFAEDLLINEDDGVSRQADPKIAMHPNGFTVICWEDNRNGNADIYMQMYTRRGQPIQNNIKVNDGTYPGTMNRPEIAMDGLGNFVITWIRIHDLRGYINFQKFAANGRAIRTNQEIIHPDVASFNQSNISMNSHGDFGIVYTHTRGDINLTDISVQLFNSSAESFGDPILVPQEGTGYQEYPDIALDKYGYFMVVWLDSHSGVDRVYARLFNEIGEPIKDETEVSTHADLTQRCWNPSLAVNTEGTYCVLWEATVDPSKSDLYICQFDSTGNRIDDILRINDPDYFSSIAGSAISAHPDFPYFEITWSGLHGGKWDIYRQEYIPGTAFTPNAEVINDADAIDAKYPDITQANMVNTLYVWEDKRDGNSNIYAGWIGEPLAFRTTVGTGFNHMVPISWEPPYGYNDITTYYIHRIDSNGTHDIIATVDPSDRALPNLMLDYIDHTAVNGMAYQYAVQVEGGRDDLMLFMPTTPSESGHVIKSNWLQSMPTIDGSIDPNEWDDANRIWDISNPSSNQSMPLYIKNNYTHLYLAISDPNDDFVDPANRFGMLFDENNDNLWESAFNIGEGMFYFSNTSQLFTSFMGPYPNNLRSQLPVTEDNIQIAISASNGNVQYEVCIDLTQSALTVEIGDTLGTAIWIEDPGHFYGYGYGNAAEWPTGALWDAAAPLGDLILATPADLDTTIIEDWVNPDGHRERDNWARGETELYPPFLYEDIINLGHEAFSLLSYEEPILYLNSADSKNMSHNIAYNTLVGEIIWNDSLEYDRGGILFATPAVTDSFVIFSRSDGLIAFDKETGIHIWQRDPAIPDYGGGPVIQDDTQLYWVAESLYCINKSNGKSKWSFPRISIFGAVADNQNVFIAESDTLYVLDKWTGTLIGQVLVDESVINFMALDNNHFYSYRNDSLLVRSKDTYEIIWGKPYLYTILLSPLNNMAINEDVICLVAINIEEECVTIVAYDKDTGTELWSNNIGQRPITGPVIANDVVYIVEIGQDESNGSVIGLNIETGEEIFRDSSIDYRGYPIVGKKKLIVPFRGGVKIFSNSEIREGTSVENIKSPQPLKLFQNYPNPFNPETQIYFSLLKPGLVNIVLYDINGRYLLTLTKKYYQAGSHQITLDASDFPSGVYFYKIKAGNFTDTKKCLLIK